MYINANICSLCYYITDGKTIERKTNNSSWFNAFFGGKNCMQKCGLFANNTISYRFCFKAWEFYINVAILTSGNSETSALKVQIILRLNKRNKTNKKTS